MKCINSKSLLALALLFLCIFCSTSCNKDKPTFTRTQIEELLQQMKGTYHGRVDVAYFHGKRISIIADGECISSDILTFKMSLIPIAETIKDESVAQTLHRIGDVEVRAHYKFEQKDGGFINFSLQPQDVIVFGGVGSPPTIKLFF